MAWRAVGFVVALAVTVLLLGAFGTPFATWKVLVAFAGGAVAYAVIARRGLLAPGSVPGGRGAGRPAVPLRGKSRWLTTPPSPTRFGVAELARRLGVDASALRAARAAYTAHQIPKRSGGMRTIHVPDPATKALQRRILRRLLARVPAHPACHGFERGRSIRSNVAPHVGRAVVVRLDVRDFFGSTAARRVRRLYRVLGWDRESARILTRLTTYGGGLPQGAPTSPRLANLVNVRLDARLAGLAAARSAAYTRYADDLTFSFVADDAGAIHSVIRVAKRYLQQDGYELHEGRKLRIRRQHERQLVTGLVVNRSPALPRARRRWLRSVEHHLRVGRPATLTRPQLAGWHAYELMIAEPPPNQARSGT